MIVYVQNKFLLQKEHFGATDRGGTTKKGVGKGACV